MNTLRLRWQWRRDADDVRQFYVDCMQVAKCNSAFRGESDGRMLKPRYRPASAITFSLVPVSGISAAAFSPACTLGTVV